MAQVVPTMVDEVMSDLTISRLEVLLFAHSSQNKRDQKGCLPLNGTQNRLSWREHTVLDTVSCIQTLNAVAAYRT